MMRRAGSASPDALDALRALPGTKLNSVSPFIETAAVTLPGSTAPQPDYLNAAAELSTTLPPRDLLNALLGIERHQLGVRVEANLSAV